MAGTGIRYAYYPESQGTNWWTLDPNLQRLMQRYLGPLYGWAAPRLDEAGALVGGRVAANAMRTDRPAGRPRLEPYDREGQDVSQIVYSPEYAENVRLVYPLGIVAHNHAAPPGLAGPLPYVYTMALGYLVSQAEVGFYCPVTLTATVAYVLERYGSPELTAEYLPRLTALDPDLLQQGATFLTEKAGGSDVGAIESTARLEEGRWHITGEKWFASNAGAPLALVLARAAGDPPGTAGLSLFLVPRTLPDGRRNAVRIRRLKEKLGTHAVATGELLLEGAEGFLVGERGRGFKYMVEGLNLSRLCNAVGSTAIMRRAFLEAATYTHRRIAFGTTLDHYPMVQETLVQMLLETEAAAALTFRAAAAFDASRLAGAGSRERGLMRLLLPLAKYRTGEQAVAIASDAIELLGGNGYVEEYVTPRLLRDAQVTTVWEGTANILALDMLRALRKEPGAAPAFWAETEVRLEQAAGHAPLAGPVGQAAAAAGRLRAAMAYLQDQNEDYVTLHAKRLADLMVEVSTAALLLEEAAEDLAAGGNARKAAMARLYIEKYLDPPPGRGITTGDTLLLRLSRRLIGYGHVSPEELDG